MSRWRGRRHLACTQGLRYPPGVTKQSVEAQTVELQDTAMYLAMCVRNAMEEFHHDHLSDAQMAELNPIIRNAIFTGLYARHYAGSDLPEGEGCASYALFQARLIPDYWEAPELNDDLSCMRGRHEQGAK